MAIEVKLNLPSIIERLLKVRGARPGKNVNLSEAEIRGLCLKSREIFISQPVLLELLPPIKVLGDIHGQYYDLLRFFEYGGFPPKANYLFLGNYVDYGKQPIETVCLLLAYKIQYPENFFLLRGNHECASINRKFGFYDACKRRYNIRLWKTFTDCFNCLPVAAIIDEKIFCCHGGLSPDFLSLDNVRGILRPTDVPDQGLLCDLLWADPDPAIDGWGENMRGVSFTFGAKVVTKFLAKHDFDLIVRSHQIVEDGYEFFAKRGLVTLFSSLNFKGEYDNPGAMMTVAEDLTVSFQILQPASELKQLSGNTSKLNNNESQPSTSNATEISPNNHTASQNPVKKAATEAERKKVCERVLQAKSLITIIVVIFNYLGLPRSGKTSFRRRITGEIENIMMARQNGECEQPSTGVMEDGGQVLIKPSCTEIGVIRSKIWSAIRNLGDEANMIGHFFRQVSKEDEIASDNDQFAAAKPSAVTDNAPDSPKSRNFFKRLFRKRKGASVKVQSTAPVWFDYETDSSSAATKTTAGKEAEDTDHILSFVTSAMDAEEWEVEAKNLLEDTILLVNNDTGGHAEFLDLQGALIQGPSFNLLFSRLVDDFDSLFKIYYTDEEGKSSEKEDSTMTVEEVMYQALSGIACFSGAFSPDGPGTSRSKAMLIGTHRDMVSEEDFRAKDEHLRRKLEGTEFYKRDIIQYVSEDQLMIAVDNLKGDQAEIEGIQAILEKVIMKNFVKVSIPASWLLLSLYIRKKKYRTLSLKSCEELAAKLTIDSQELQSALWFLHHSVGVLLYYPQIEALKDTVICQMQVVFDSVSNLIRNTFTFDKVGKRVSTEFREKGQFSLNDVKEATSGHTDSLIPLEKLVILLQHLNVLTPIPPQQSPGRKADASDPTYFMPCVLRMARASELKSPNSSNQDPAPLMLRYECGYVPTGVFPAMITNLVSQQREDWKLIEEGLYKNRVQFHVGEDFDVATFILRPRYFEVALSRNDNFEDQISSSLCTHVRSLVQSTLSTVTSSMNSKFSMAYKYGFECPLHPGRDHLCVLSKEGAKIMECLENPKSIKTVRLEPRHMLWFLKEGEPIPDLFSALDSPDNFGELFPSLKTLDLIRWKDKFDQTQKFQLVSEVSMKWKDFGLRLGMTLNDLDALDHEYRGNVKDIWHKVMDHWLAGEAAHDYPVSWKGLYSLLNDVELSEAAKQLERAVNEFSGSSSQ